LCPSDRYKTPTNGYVIVRKLVHENECFVAIPQCRKFTLCREYGHKYAQAAIFSPSDFSFHTMQYCGATQIRMTLIADVIWIIKAGSYSRCSRNLSNRRLDLYRFRMGVACRDYKKLMLIAINSCPIKLETHQPGSEYLSYQSKNRRQDKFESLRLCKFLNGVYFPFVLRLQNIR